MNHNNRFFGRPLRLSLLALLGSVLLASCSGDADPGTRQTLATANTEKTMRVFKSPSCGCCGKWVDHMTASGFSVEVKDSNNLLPIKEKYGIDRSHQSCHTAVFDGYVFEGHIPAEIVQRFLQEKPKNARGLAVPGMPAGSPGMEMGSRHDDYNVMQLNSDGSRTIYQHVSKHNTMPGTDHGDHNEHL